MSRICNDSPCESRQDSGKRNGSVGLAAAAVRLFVPAALLVSLTGCSFIGKKVKAYERNILSKPGMALIENGKEQASMNHMFNAREGSTGGLGGAGGGCGCN